MTFLVYGRRRRRAQTSQITALASLPENLHFTLEMYRQSRRVTTRALAVFLFFHAIALPVCAFQLFPIKHHREPAKEDNASPKNEISRALNAVQDLVRNFDVCAPSVGDDGAIAVDDSEHRWPLAQMLFSSLVDSRSAVDVTETADTITFAADVPGIDLADLTVDVIGNVLTIRGERADEGPCDSEASSCEIDSARHKRERHFGKFVNKFILPPNAVIDQISAFVKKGVLKVLVPKASAPEPVHVPVVAVS